MKYWLVSVLLCCLPAAAFCQICAVSVSSQGLVLGVGQSEAVRNVNTAALRKMFADIGRGAIPCHNVQFPEGILEINGSISIPLGPITLAGVNRERSIILQTTAAPVFLWNSNNAYTTGIFVHDLGFDNSNTKAPYHPAQIGLQFQCTADGRGGNSWGYANNQFERLSISHMNIGLEVFTTGGGVCGFWSTHFEDMKFYNMQSNAVYMVASGNIGQPANQFDRIDILQENAPPVTTGPAIYIVGGSGLLMNSIDIEGWHNTEIDIYGGNGTVINNLRVEHAVFDSTPFCNPSIGFFDGDVTLNGTVISWDSFRHTCLANVFSLAGEGTALTVNGLSLGSTIGPPKIPITLWRVEKPNPPGKIFASSLNLGKIASEYVPSGNGMLTSTLYSRYTIDQLPPPVDKLPSPEARYVGRSFLLVNGDSQMLYQCVENAGAYKWVSR